MPTLDRWTFSGGALMVVTAACSSTITGPGTAEPPGQCTSDSDCSSSSSCQQWRCVVHQCQSTDVPDGTNDPNPPPGLVCQRAVCDGMGGYRTVPDSSAVPVGQAAACKHFSCDSAGNPTTTTDPTNPPPDTPHDCARESCDPNGNVILKPDPSDTPIDTPHDCQKESCGGDGGITLMPDPTDTPVDQPGDCKKDTCNADGTIGQVPDNSDPPPPSTCFSYTCANGTSSATPINATTKCSALGYVCGSDGQCATCATPDAACDETGPATRNASAPWDFQGIGHCDDGGRYFCGAVPTGQADYLTYYDDGTGLLCSFDPYFEIEPMAPATMCVYFGCPSVGCPAGSTPDTSAAGQPGCCLTAQPGAFTGMSINFCDSGRVTLKVTTAAACAGYQLHFHD